MARTDEEKVANAQASQDEHDNARDEMDRMEAADSVPSDPRDWPSGKSKFLTFGRGADDRYGDGATAKLGPAEVTHHAGGSVSVSGKLVDNPKDYKGEPIPGGPTDPGAAKLARETKRSPEAGAQAGADLPS
jgi:hypothetical protein